MALIPEKKIITQTDGSITEKVTWADYFPEDKKTSKKK